MKCNNKLPFLIGIIVLAVCASALTTKLMPRRNISPIVATGYAVQETAYQHILRTGTLRCGYFIEPPFTQLDTATNARSGIAFDLATKITQELGLKLEWTQEVNFATLADDLATGRYDAVCASVFVLPRAGRLDYTRPYAFVPVYGYVRKGDTRFNAAFANIDWPKYKIGGLDGEGATTAARKLLPQAQFEILPQSSQISDMLAAVAGAKTDIGFVLPTVFKSFDANNPGVLQQAQLDHPLYTYAVSFGIKPEESGLKDMLDSVILELTVSGELQTTLDHYDPDKLFIRPSAK